MTHLRPAASILVPDPGNHMRPQFSGWYGILTLVAVSLVAKSAAADIALSKLFSDHMVLQQNQSMRVNGTADAEEKLAVSFRGQVVDVVADQDGKWSAVIGTGPAGGPFQLEVASQSSATKVIFSDVLVGEVWLCGGQSNMTDPIRESSISDQVIEAAKEFPAIRAFNVAQNTSVQPLHDFANVEPWFCCAPEAVKDFSAIGYLFGRELNKQLDVPVGLICIGAEMTTLEAWTPYETLQQEGSFDQLLGYWQERGEPNNPNRVANSYNAMVAPIAGFAFRGIIWYQGEANIGRGAQYRRMFPLMIQSWRKKLGQPHCPFLFVQPTPFRYSQHSVEALPEIWDAQFNTFKELDGLGMVVTTDLASEQANQPKQKLPIAKRLAGWAFSQCYSAALTDTQELARLSGDHRTHALGGDEIGITHASLATGQEFVASGPLFKSARILDDRIVVKFDMTDGGLKLDRQSNHGITICGKDRNFVPARATVDGDQLIVFHPDIRSPIAVRYGWTDTAKPSLRNAFGLPASPFRTDQFPLLSQGIEF